MKTTRRTSLKTITVLVLLASLLALMLIAFRWGLADVYGHQAHKYIEQWREQQTVSLAETEAAMSWVLKARALDPGNPGLMNHQAKILQRQARLTENKQVSSKRLESAAQLYRDALASRPTWPYDWIALANIKAQLRQFDQEFSKSLERSSSLGPWEYPVQLGLVEIGFRHWSQLTSAEQDIIHQSFDRALQGNRFTIFIQLAKQYDQLELFCARSNNGQSYNKTIQRHSCQ